MTAALAERRHTAEERLEELRRERGRAVAAGKPFDNRLIVDLAGDIESYREAETASVEAAREESGRELAKRRAVLISEAEAAEAARLEALAAAEQGLRDYIASLNAALAAGGQLAKLVAQLGMRPRFDTLDARNRYGQYTAAALKTLNVPNQIGSAVTWSSSWRLPDADWKKCEARETATLIAQLKKGI